MTQSKDVTNFRRRIKEALVQGFGDKCCICKKKYPNYIYEFHHINPSTKKYNLSHPDTRAKTAYPEEAKKCCMVCANCHREIEYSGEKFELKCNFNEQIYYETLEELIAPLKKEREEQAKIRKEMREQIEANKPNREKLKTLIRSTSFEQIARDYGYATGNTVKKWCKKLRLPHLRKEIEKYSDEEWELI